MMTQPLVSHRFARCELALPEDWQVLPGVTDRQAVAVEPPGSEGSDASGFRANLVLTVVDNGGMSFRDWQASTDELLPRQLNAYQLLDLERRDVSGHPGGRRLAQHVVPGSPPDVVETPVTMEQWFAQVGTTGYTLTATVDSWRYDLLADMFAGLADRLVLPAGDHTGTGSGGGSR